MKNAIAQVVRVGFALALICSSLACSENGASLFIHHVPVPDPSDECKVTPDPSGLQILHGTLDKSLSLTYIQSFVVGNQLIPRGDSDTLRPETSRVQIYEVEVSVFDFLGNLLTEFTVPATGFVGESEGTTPGYGLTFATLIDAGTASRIDTSQGSQTVVARVKIYGQTLGGLEVETGFWDFPIYVCGDPGNFSCIGYSVPEACDDEVIEACYLGQDSIHDCREIEDQANVSLKGCDC